MTTMNSPSAPQKPKLLDRVCLTRHTRHYSPTIEDGYDIRTVQKLVVHMDVATTMNAQNPSRESS